MKLRRIPGISSKTVMWLAVADWTWLLPFFAAVTFVMAPARYNPLPPWALLLAVPVSLVWVRLSFVRVADGVEVRALCVWLVVPVKHRRQPVVRIATSRSSDDLDHDDEIQIYAESSGEAWCLEAYQAPVLAATMREAMTAVARSDGARSG